MSKLTPEMVREAIEKLNHNHPHALHMETPTVTTDDFVNLLNGMLNPDEILFNLWINDEWQIKGDAIECKDLDEVLGDVREHAAEGDKILITITDHMMDEVGVWEGRYQRSGDEHFDVEREYGAGIGLGADLTKLANTQQPMTTEA